MNVMVKTIPTYQTQTFFIDSNHLATKFLLEFVELESQEMCLMYHSKNNTSTKAYLMLGNISKYNKLNVRVKTMHIKHKSFSQCQKYTGDERSYSNILCMFSHSQSYLKVRYFNILLYHTFLIIVLLIELCHQYIN